VLSLCLCRLLSISFLYLKALDLATGSSSAMPGLRTACPPAADSSAPQTALVSEACKGKEMMIYGKVCS
jgi:hypothetical protein